MFTRITATALVERDSKYLLVEEFAHGRVVLNNPSGAWEVGETLAETAAREAAEETGVVFEPRDRSILATPWLSYEEFVANKDRHRSSAVLRSIEDHRSKQMCALNTVSAMIDS